MKKNNYPIYFLISLAVLIIDQATKYLIQARLKLFETVEVLPFFNIVFVSNTGSAFGMLKGLGNVFFIVVAGAAIVIVAVLIIKFREDRLAFSLVMGGAAGNLMDRLTHGYVVDFLDFFAGGHHWPAFNVADSALTVGIALLFIKTLFGPKDTGKQEV